jgi:hypothetical protein
MQKQGCQIGRIFAAYFWGVFGPNMYRSTRPHTPAIKILYVLILANYYFGSFLVEFFDSSGHPGLPNKAALKK